MTLVYSRNKLPLESLTIPAEAVRGLRFKNGKWLLFASDPEPMAVSVFSLRKEALEDAAYSIQHGPAPGQQKPLKPEDGRALLEWLLYQQFVKVDVVEAGGLPSMFPPFAGAGPKPNMGMKPPSIDR